MATTIPAKTSVLVIGGGPGGSYAATALKHEGFDVVLLESTKFPRYHIGESMLPSMRHYLRFIDLEDKFMAHGFKPKRGASFKLRQDSPEAYTDFSTLGPGRITWNVIRSEADEILLRHAADTGVQVFEETRVDTIAFDPPQEDPAVPVEPSARPVSASWTRKDGSTGTISFDWLVDASGRIGIMSTKYLKNRVNREGLKNVAVWGYWKNTKVTFPGTKKEDTPWFEALTDEQGWAWFIPLHDGTVSVGVVMHHSASVRKKTANPGVTPSTTEHYLDQVKLVPGIVELLSDQAELVPDSVKAGGDNSYFARAYAGNHFRLVGDAASFIDPFFSSGVHLALTGALSAAATICASTKGQVSEGEAEHWHNAKIGICHTRFLLVVLSAYKQMQIQSKPILSDVNDTNFDAAFHLFRPVIQGDPDISKKLTEEELEKTIDFCIHLFEPTREEQFAAVAKNFQPDLLNIHGAVLSEKSQAEAVNNDPSAKQVLSRVNALKVLRNDTSCDSFGTESVSGYLVTMERGSLGLVKSNE